MARTIRIPPSHLLDSDPTPSLAMPNERPSTVPMEDSNAIVGRGPFEGPGSIQQPDPNQQIPPAQDCAPIRDAAQTEEARQAAAAAEALNRRRLTYCARLIHRGRPSPHTSTPAPNLHPSQVFDPFTHQTVFTPAVDPQADAEMDLFLTWEQSDGQTSNNTPSIFQSGVVRSPQSDISAQPSPADTPTEHPIVTDPPQHLLLPPVTAPTASDAKTALSTFGEWTCHVCRHDDQSVYHCRHCGHVQCGGCRQGVDETAAETQRAKTARQVMYLREAAAFSRET